MDKKKLQMVIIALPIVLIAGGFIYYKYLLSPLSVQQKKISDELVAIKKEYRLAVGKAARLPVLEQEIKYLGSDISRMEKKLPKNKDVAKLIRMLSKKMDNHNIVWLSLTPGAPSAQAHHVEHSYTIPFTTTYHDLAKFLSEIGQMERIFATRFTALTSTTDSETGATEVSGLLTFLIYTAKT